MKSQLVRSQGRCKGAFTHTHMPNLLCTSFNGGFLNFFFFLQKYCEIELFSQSAHQRQSAGDNH